MTDTPEPGLYADYGGWKGWENPFVCPPDRARYYATEARGRSLAGAHVLEIGFGNGEFLGWAKAQGALVTGSEITPAAVAAAKAAEIPLLPADFETAGIAADQFDIIAAFDVFEHQTPNGPAGAKFRFTAAPSCLEQMVSPAGFEPATY